MLNEPIGKYLLIFFLIIFIADCKKPFNPPAITAINNFLVVDGIINIGTNGITSVNVNRTRNLGDTATLGIPELNALVSVSGTDGNSYSLSDADHDGIYESDPLTLDIHQNYRIEVSTSDGRKYASEYVSGKITPLIDSIYYEQPSDITFFVSTHDPGNSTRYYRWTYSETWAHDAQLQTPWVVENGLISVADSSNQISLCWTTVNSSNVLLGNTAALSNDIIARQQLIKIPLGDVKILKRYSLLVKQYALTAEAYNYWSIIQKTSDQLGSLFDLQPSQLMGNYHCITNPSEPVIGFASASTLQQTRIFVFNSLLHNWIHNQPEYTCDTIEEPVDQRDYRIYHNTDTSYAPYYFISNGPLVLASTRCLNCLLFGGTNQKPSFW